jgi:hypothetical protein
VIDIQAIQKAGFDQLFSHAAGATLRAALGAGANSIVHADTLTLNTLPARPLVAFRGGAVAGESMQMRVPTWRWWIYDDLEHLYWRINGVLPLIEAAYPQFLSAVFGRVFVTDIGPERPDPGLGNMPCRWVQFAFSTRG